ncbi:adenosylmethionine--8-amino-7-oxononanoate transaminase [Hufsiella ginkgonis]|uniref:Adenosylmethionine-8-amino-7-oxononanoate aminotransferase n=1 Tax=Hufsiella ginkgonis TaxID=2695274 RepID=A0A7K1XXH2_9SPHI|nr:adenosylmethionine--8-amino-7-oxononanoate transaminase [Hufsiella ginkgonis]MXV15537.1 adenosylmethionine--8-amino-7-oxononanoate transaminase [Hufsiella ginkgonis]
MNEFERSRSSLVSRDQSVIWHPYTQMKTALPPIPIVKGSGVYLEDELGNRYIDAVSSWWVNIHGHSHPYIAARVAEQLHTLEHVIFAGFTHPGAVALAERLIGILPSGQQKIFYSDNGSTAVEVALKMCFQFWANQGEQRTRVIALKNSYHGDTFGAMAVSARSAFTGPFDRLLFGVDHIDAPNGENLAAIRKQVTALKGKAAALIFEPLVQGAGGMLMHDPGHLDELVAICKENDILVIADEVMTGFGRTGKLFAMEHLVNRADIMCLSKGLTGGTMALGVTSCTDRIYRAFLSDDKLKTLFHGHSFTANPVACASALASLDILQEEETRSNIKLVVEKHGSFKEKINGHPKLKEVRHTGTILALEWETGGDTSYFNSLRDELYNFFLGEGIILRPLGNIIYVMPPYCINEKELDYIYTKIEEALARF